MVHSFLPQSVAARRDDPPVSAARFWRAVSGFVGVRSGRGTTFGLIFGVCAIIAAYACSRVSIFLIYHPWWAGDSGGYTQVARHIWSGELQSIDGVRTPTYPLFLLAAQLLAGGEPELEVTLASAQLITWIQATLSLLSLGCIYHLGRRLFGLTRGAAMLATFIIAGSFCIALYDRILLTESLSTSLLLFSVSGLVQLDSARRSGKLATLAVMSSTGAILGAAVLIRPNLIAFLAAVTFGIIGARIWRVTRRGRLLDAKGRGSSVWVAVRRFALPLMLALGITGSWVGFNYRNSGYAKLANFEGIALATRCYNCADAVADKYPAFAKIMKELNDKYKAQGIVREDLVHDGLGRMLQDTQSGAFDIHVTGSSGRVLGAFNDHLSQVMRLAISRRPDLYFDNVMNSVRKLPKLTTPFVPATESAIDPRVPERRGTVNRWPAAHHALCGVVRFGDELASWILWIFYCLPFTLIARPVRRHVQLRLLSLWLGIAGMNLVACMLTAWFDRYSVVTYPFCVLWVIWLLAIFWGHARSRLRARLSPLSA